MNVSPRAGARAPVRSAGGPRSFPSAIFLILPALSFIAVFFVVPLAGFLSRSLDNSEVNSVLPQTVATLRGWTSDTPVPEGAYSSLISELRSSDDTKVAELARRLNSLVPSFRSLILRTKSRLTDQKAVATKSDLLAIVPQWAEPHYWAKIRDAGGAVTFDYYLRAFDLERRDDGSVGRVSDDQKIFISVFTRTFMISLVITLICVMIAYPAAYLIATVKPRTASIVIFLVLLPFWTSLLVRTSAWILLLQRDGLLNNILLTLRLIDSPLHLIFNRFGLFVAMTHVLLPFAVLPLLGSMKRVPANLTQAAISLGAHPIRAFIEVYIPQTYPGIAASATLVFVLALGYYITPAMVGGPADQLIGSFVAFYTNVTVNWGLAAALSAILLAFTLMIYFSFVAVFGSDKLKV